MKDPVSEKQFVPLLRKNIEGDIWSPPRTHIRLNVHLCAHRKT